MKGRGWSAGLALAAILVGGCAAPHPRISDKSFVVLEIDPTGVASVFEAEAAREGGGMVVSGTVKKYHEFFLSGHVDIVVCDHRGDILGRKTTRLFGGYASKRGGVREGRFSARMELPPSGSKVRVKYHAPGSGEDHLGCN